MYQRGNEAVRSILNRAFFTKLYVDGTKIVDHQLNEPFDVLAEAYTIWRHRQTGRRTYGRQAATQARAGARIGNGLASLVEREAVSRVSRLAMIDSLASSLADVGWSKAIVVEVAGIEPASFGTSPGLLRAQPALAFLSPGVPAGDSPTGSAAVRCPGQLRGRADQLSLLTDARTRAGGATGLTTSLLA